jgi:hypothetical protein
MLSLSSESICLVNGKQNIIQPVFPAEQGFLHFNNLWCYHFYKLTGEEKDYKGIAAFFIVLSKNLTITALLDRVFPAIASTNNQPMLYVTTKTVAYRFALVIDCVTVFHQDSPHSRALQHEASILKELDSMPPDDFQTELRGSLTNFYEDILKKACSGGRPVAMPLSRKFVTNAASLPAPDPAAGADGDENNVVKPRADSDAAAPPPGPAAAEAAAVPPLLLRHRCLPGGSVPAEAVASPRLLD